MVGRRLLRGSTRLNSDIEQRALHWTGSVPAQAEDVTMSGYVIADVDWADEDARLQYLELLAPTLDQFGGQFIASATSATVEEGDWEHHGILNLLRFPSLDKALEWYRSDEYKPALRLRQESAKSRLLIFEGR
jgi:uncharacterized protein (DUF1330 family)